MLPMISSAASRCEFSHVGGVQLLPEVLLQSFLAGNRVKEKLPSLFVLRISGRVADVLGHVIPPFLVQLGQPLELLLELAVVLGAFLGLERVNFFFENRIGLQLLLNDIPEFQSRRLQYLQALLQLWREHLLHCQILELMDPRTGHTEYCYVVERSL